VLFGFFPQYCDDGMIMGEYYSLGIVLGCIMLTYNTSYMIISISFFVQNGVDKDAH
jgi:hypothetical protein